MDTKQNERILTWLETVADRLRASLSENINVKQKESAKDLVTEMDTWAEQYLVEQIRQHYPTDRILGEEGCGDQIEDVKGTLWIIDPIDGTLNFVKQKNYFAIMIGIFTDGKPVAGYIYDVMNHAIYSGIVGEGAYVNGQPLTLHDYDTIGDSLVMLNVTHAIENRNHMQRVANASLGVRSNGSAGLQVVSVLRGEMSLYFSCGLHPWDYAAGWAICEALGIRVSDVNGQPLDLLSKSTALFAVPGVYQEALDLLTE